MARLPRLSAPGVMHYLLQRGHNGGAIVRDGQDSDSLLQTLREAALSHGVVLHAYALTATDLRVLATPESADGVSRMMQAVGRRYAAAFNRRHGRSGALWDGRFRSALIEDGPPALLALRHLEGAAAATPPAADVSTAPDGTERSSRSHRTGGRRDSALVDPPAFWLLGNTPFERESTYRALLADPLAGTDEAALLRAVRGGGAWGSSQFLQQRAAETDRPLQPRPRGRPRRSP
jgi:putative transposase